MILSYEKSKVLHLRRPKYLKRPPIFKINNHNIKAENSIPYLGITLDSTLSFLPHLKNKRQELQKTIQNLMKFSSSKSKLSKYILKVWYKTILEKKITYAAPIWFHKLQKSHGYRLVSSIQAQCLLMISRAYRKTATLALCTLTGIPPLVHQLRKDSIVGRVLCLGVLADGLRTIGISSKS